MKVRKIAVALVVAVFIAMLGVKADQATMPVRSTIEGTWEHIFDNAPNLRQIKVINQDYFMWITYDRESKMTLYSAGGPYTFKGNSYKEFHEFGRFGSPKYQELVGHEQVFEVRFKGESLLLTGTLSNGMELSEVWNRIK